MHVLFVEPNFPRNQREFVRALAHVGARVTAIGESPLTALDSETKRHLHGYERVPSVVDEQALYHAVRAVQDREWVDRLEATIEAHILPVARVRDATGIPGTSVRTAYLCRDKPAMKEALREAGVPCAQSTGATSREEVLSFANEVGYPLILKPRDAAGASGTYRAGNKAELEAAMDEAGLDLGLSVAVEEFIEGHEAFYDTLCLEGQVVHDFVCHYYPGVLEAMRERWISPQIVCTNRTDDSTYDEVRALGKKVIEVLGIGTSATHMEWFFGPKGLKFSEIGCRPPGVGTWDLYGAGNDIDLYREWAQIIVHGHTDSKVSRSHASGLIALRPDQDGKIVSYEGVEAMMSKYSESIIDAHFPPSGSVTQPVAGGYMANAWVRAKHPNYDELRGILSEVGERVRVHAK